MKIDTPQNDIFNDCLYYIRVDMTIEIDSKIEIIITKIVNERVARMVGRAVDGPIHQAVENYLRLQICIK